ncbi:uncharacterized protein FMAN_07633 [Fusarium mangiferae]|uniref:Uncharacterized protein n=1 Tax=Fusarium mangiferae TaxID=192010 RepID=A0A1L7T4D7_FUSMA|nr:uncharacterized protein FMAN_07633 [Fusarium mangiferae]CVK92789.1 uncharacterized protein FMAN_07633 [Fusarium mangiferae]
MKAQATGWFHLLLSVHGQLLPGFHAGTVARFGVGPCAGLVVHLDITVGNYRQPHTHFKFTIRHGRRSVPFMDLIVPLDYIVAAIPLNSIDADDINSLAHFCMLNAMDISEFANHVKDFDTLVRSLRIDVDWSKLFVIDSLEFKRNIKRYPSTTHNITFAVSSQLKKSMGLLKAWFFQEVTFNRTWPDILANLNQFKNPYADYLVDTRFGYRDLTYKNASTYFMGAEHRTVALLAGAAAEEQEMVDNRALALLDTPILAVVWPDIFSSWEPQDDDLEVYGILFLPFSILSLGDEKQGVTRSSYPDSNCEGAIRGEAIAILGFHEECGTRSDIGRAFDNSGSA